jgi:mono/diheme cytochrome c family protein
MKTHQAIGCPPLLEEPRANDRARRPWPALLALTLVAPAVWGCPGHLDELPSIFVDAAGPQIPMTPINGGPPAKLDAAALPPPGKLDAAALPPPGKLDAAVAATPPPAIKPPPTVDKNTCAGAADIAAKIFTPKCAICHSGPMAPAGLDLASAGIKARLVNVASKSALSGCKGQVLATADGSAGVIFNKLLGMGCGAQMPAMGPTLTNQEYWCIKEWLSPGAGGPYPDPAGFLPVVMQPPPAMTPPPMTPPVGGGGKLDGGVAAIPAMTRPFSCASTQEITANILKPKCLPCHDASMHALGLDLESPGAKARLLGVSAKSCANQTLARRDGTGLLFDTVTNNVPLGCGQPMPFGGVAPLTGEEVACLSAWLRM